MVQQKEQLKSQFEI